MKKRLLHRHLYAAALATALVLGPVVGPVGLLGAAPASANTRGDPSQVLTRTGYSRYVVDVGPRVRGWPVAAAMSRVDAATGSSMVRGDCPRPRPRGVGCIRIETHPYPGRRIAVTSWWHNGLARIRLDPQYRGRSDTFKRAALIHEFGHAFGLPHSADCHSYMYPQLSCLSSKRFTASDRAHLAGQ